MGVFQDFQSCSGINFFGTIYFYFPETALPGKAGVKGAGKVKVKEVDQQHRLLQRDTLHNHYRYLITLSLLGRFWCSELEALHGSLTLLKKELLLLQVDGGGQGRILILRAEVALDQVECLLVYLLVLVTLQELQLIQT